MHSVPAAGFILLSVLFYTAGGSCSEIGDLLATRQIAVEETTGRGGRDGAGFVGRVGTFRCDLLSRHVYIAVFSEYGVHMKVGVDIFSITSLTTYGNALSFKCLERGTNRDWEGKVWLNDENQPQVEMASKSPPLTWKSLGPEGIKLLDKHGMKRLTLGD